MVKRDGWGTNVGRRSPVLCEPLPELRRIHLPASLSRDGFVLGEQHA
jgi:hypothetical protein